MKKRQFNRIIVIIILSILILLAFCCIFKTEEQEAYTVDFLASCSVEELENITDDGIIKNGELNSPISEEDKVILLCLKSLERGKTNEHTFSVNLKREISWRDPKYGNPLKREEIIKIDSIQEKIDTINKVLGKEYLVIDGNFVEFNKSLKQV